ncbi:MAG: DUF2188 domain-containing protein [Phascolarctobacterium sp.]|uniref:DUF2188 domain-containing protein n=1 Tax=Phascolarctobacterium sp. TaxID=2049039 RepID=UPI0026DC86CC|nr:DUF2188 domain-containing protein [Phascolarctobacterium sp.]MDO4920410.1 DUF2188 domain-containing protein [Phascolarctobacterium sp.]
MKKEFVVGPVTEEKIWKITDCNSKKIIGTYKLQKEAFEQARKKAKENPDGGEISLQARNGKIRLKHSYGKENDPRNIKG